MKIKVYGNSLERFTINQIKTIEISRELDKEYRI